MKMSYRSVSPQLSFLINENILGKCFRRSSSFVNPRISPLTMKYECPQPSLLIITLVHFADGVPHPTTLQAKGVPLQLGN